MIDDAAPPLSDAKLQRYRERITDLEARLRDSEETLDAIRQGDFDAVVVHGPDNERQVYTLENADRPYRVLIEQIQEGALTLDGEGIILYGNRRLAEMIGAPQEKLIGQALQRFVGPADLAGLARLRHAAENGTARGELTLHAEDGNRLPVHISLSLLQRDEATPLLCGVLTDLSDQKRQLESLAEANARLQAEGEERERVEDALRQSQKMEAVGQLTGGIAHDFNNLLTVIKSSTDLLRRPDLAEERRRRYVNAIADTVDRASRLTSQLLAFARRQTLEPEVFEVNDRLHRITEMLGTVVGSRIRVDRSGSREPCFVEADASQFETALVNLAVNARDAMEGEGILTLRVEGDATLPVIRGHPTGAGAFVSISIADTGCGIPAETIAHIFEPFFTTKAVGKGTGLGLSQVFGFAKQSGGNIAVESEVGQGTVFTLYLPQVSRGGAATHDDAQAIPRDKGGGRRVLVVEDNTEVGTFSTQLLQDLGYNTTWAANGDEALALLHQDPAGFDVVFSDVVMPGMNGVDLGRRIRAGHPDLPVILTSGYSDILAGDGRHGFELLRKPYSVEDLSRVLRRASRARSLHPPGSAGE
ncbi:MAG TPA: ATP-binding protein [Lichenihabitans sp.]|jgi:PAS domain S-box-containing protein|nr:ATP-binding protein [Lichenihabitans sp.]